MKSNGPHGALRARADAHSTGLRAPAVELSRLHVGTRWTQSVPQVSEGGDRARKPHLLRPRAEFQHREEAVVFLRADYTLPFVNDLCSCPDPSRMCSGG